MGIPVWFRVVILFEQIYAKSHEFVIPLFPNPLFYEFFFSLVIPFVPWDGIDIIPIIDAFSVGMWNGERRMFYYPTKIMRFF